MIPDDGELAREWRRFWIALGAVYAVCLLIMWAMIIATSLAQSAPHPSPSVAEVAGCDPPPDWYHVCPERKVTP